MDLLHIHGCEARRADIEAQAQTLLTEMPFPSAPLATELAIVGEKLLASLPKCKGERPKGTGGEITPTFEEAAALGIVMPLMVLGKANESLISPVTRSESYCVVETFFPRKDLAVTAIEYTGPATDAWEARYGFAIANGRGGYYQIERLAQAEPMKSMAGEASTKHAYLDFSNNKRASLFAVFDEWPSYEAAKQAIEYRQRITGRTQFPDRLVPHLTCWYATVTQNGVPNAFLTLKLMEEGGRLYIAGFDVEEVADPIPSFLQPKAK